MAPVKFSPLVQMMIEKAILGVLATVARDRERVCASTACWGEEEDAPGNRKTDRKITTRPLRVFGFGFDLTSLGTPEGAAPNWMRNC